VRISERATIRQPYHRRSLYRGGFLDLDFGGKQMRTLAIMVLRNGLSMTKPAVASILAQTEPCDILLIENASSDGTAQWMQTLRYPIACSFHREQIPLAAAWNQGLQSAFTHGYDAAWVVNSDVLFRAIHRGV